MVGAAGAEAARQRPDRTDIVDAHRSHQAARSRPARTARFAARPDDPAWAGDHGRLDAVHERADWVVTLDRGIGPEFYDEGAWKKPGHARYLLDYAPDFLEGLGKKLTVTTVHDGEVRRILGEAMRKLGIAQDSESVSRVLSHLMLVSGRLALRLLRDTSLAVEAVSLAAVMAHLERREPVRRPDRGARRRAPGDLRRPGPERRGAGPAVRPSARQGHSALTAHRVRRGEGTAVPRSCRPRSLTTSSSSLTRPSGCCSASSSPTTRRGIDAALQRTRLAGLLHYYAERSARSGLIAVRPAARAAPQHRQDRGVAELPEITKAGYVISPEGAGGFPARHREVTIKVLTAADLGKAGFTTVGVAPETEAPESRRPKTWARRQ